MPVPTKTFGKGRSGIANVSVQGEKVYITFEDNGQTISCLLADAPSYIRSGRQAVTLNSNNTEIYGARPIGGSYRCIFAGFAAKEGEPPTIRSVEARSGSKNGKPWKIPTHLEFTALFDVVSGKWKNYRLVYNLSYNFSRYDPEDDADDASAITMITGDKLANFLELCGMNFDNDSIPWSENVLVFLEKLLNARKRQVIISLNENGWVKDIGSVPDEDEDEDTDAADADALAADAKAHAQQGTPHPPKSRTKEESKAKADEIADQLMGKPPKKEEKPVSAPTVLQAMLTNAKNGDTNALTMLTTLAASGNQAAKDLLATLE